MSSSDADADSEREWVPVGERETVAEATELRKTRRGSLWHNENGTARIHGPLFMTLMREYGGEDGLREHLAEGGHVVHLDGIGETTEHKCERWLLAEHPSAAKRRAEALDIPLRDLNRE